MNLPPPREEASRRPCCLLLREKSKALRSLNDPIVCTELLDCLSKNCVLLKQMGESRIKFDQTHGQCYFLVDPISTRKILDEASETITLEGLNNYYEILNEIESSLAKSPLLKEISDHFTLFLETLRSGEKKFGAVPPTIAKDITQSAELLDSRRILLDHPRLADKPQFDGIPPSQTPLPNDNPSSAEQVNRLQNQHQPKPAFNPRPQR